MNKSFFANCHAIFPNYTDQFAKSFCSWPVNFRDLPEIFQHARDVVNELCSNFPKPIAGSRFPITEKNVLIRFYEFFRKDRAAHNILEYVLYWCFAIEPIMTFPQSKGALLTDEISPEKF
jgi:hypothetical protein